MERFRGLIVALTLGAVAAFGLTACGGGGETTVIETEAEAADTTAATDEAATAETTGGEEGGGDPLTEVAAPTPSTQLDEKSSGKLVYERYETSLEPKQVEATYEEELTGAGWSIESSGGSSGGWGPYGGSDYGLTAKREDEYFDLQAGGEKGGTSYFEVCAGEGTREECDKLSDGSNDSDSGGSESDDDDSDDTDSGGS